MQKDQEMLKNKMTDLEKPVKLGKLMTEVKFVDETNERTKNTGQIFSIRKL